jgi:hypothetical protein
MHYQIEDCHELHVELLMIGAHRVCVPDFLCFLFIIFLYCLFYHCPTSTCNHVCYDYSHLILDNVNLCLRLHYLPAWTLFDSKVHHMVWMYLRLIFFMITSFGLKQLVRILTNVLPFVVIYYDVNNYLGGPT